jgi:hypothetical protein
VGFIAKTAEQIQVALGRKTIKFFGLGYIWAEAVEIFDDLTMALI